MEFPTLVYRCPGSHSCPGGSFATKHIKTEGEHNEALDAGWFATLPEAIEGKTPAPVAPVAVPVAAPEPQAAPTRAELEAQAAELGIKVHGNTSDKKLAEAIAAKLSA